MNLKFQVQIKTQKPIEDVFDAVYNPDKLSGYFTNGGASAPLNEGTTVQWAFADNPGDAPISFPVTVLQTVQDELIVIEWQGASDHNTRVEMKFEKAGKDSTVIRITETGWQDTQADLDRSYMNCMGWTQMVCCLKAHVEYGINLRKGAYEGLYKAKEMSQSGS